MANFNAPFVIKRLAPMIGRPTSARRITVHARAYTLEHAIELANGPRRRRASLQGMLEREGDWLGWITKEIDELGRSSTWIEARGKSATRGRGAA